MLFNAAHQHPQATSEEPPMAVMSLNTQWPLFRAPATLLVGSFDP